MNIQIILGFKGIRFHREIHDIFHAAKLHSPVLVWLWSKRETQYLCVGPLNNLFFLFLWLDLFLLNSVKSLSFHNYMIYQIHGNLVKIWYLIFVNHEFVRHHVPLTNTAKLVHDCIIHQDIINYCKILFIKC